MARGTRFTAILPQDGSGGQLALWGRVAHGGFSSTDGSAGPALTVDGEVTTGLLGVDYSRERLTFGAILSHSAGDGSFAGDALSGTVESRLTAVTPWLSYRASERLALWGALGRGGGEMTLTPEGGQALKTDLEWRMASLGARGRVLATQRGFTLDMTSDALWVRTTSDAVPGLAASSSEVTRLRLGLEGAWQQALASGGTLTPRLEMGLRYDGGDAETGFGLEIGGGLDWSDPERGITLGLEGRTLALHEDGAFRDWGLAATVAYDPSPGTKRGVSARVSRALGGASSSGVAALLAPETIPQAGESRAADGAWTLEAAYGLSRGRGMVGAPYTRLSGSDRVEAARLGYRIEPDATHAADIKLDLWAEPPTTRNQNASSGAALQWRW